MNRIEQALLCAALLATWPFAAAQADQGHAHHAEAGPHAEQKPWGMAGDAKAASRTIVLTMGDNMRFTPERIEVRQGEVVRFTLKNGGKLPHEFVIGTPQELDAHAAMMQKMPGMAHADAGTAQLAPGTAGDTVWNFNRAGSFDFACLIPGHYQAGMVGRIVVVAAGGKR